MKRKQEPIVYKTTNLINGKIYIGQDTYNDKLYLGSGVRLGNAIEKYGIENFKKEVLEYCKKESLSEREIFWIAHFDSTNPVIGYNITPGGEGNACKSWSQYLTVEQIERRRQRLIEYNTSPERRIAAKNRRSGKTYEQLFGKEVADELKQKCSSRMKNKNVSLKGRKLKESTKHLISESNKLKYKITFPDNTTLIFKGYSDVIEYFNELNLGRKTRSRVSPYAILYNKKTGYKCERL